MLNNPLELSFFERDTILVAKDLLGALLVHYSGKGALGGLIVETEAYLGLDDPACHSARGRTKRNKTMFKGPGFSYVYLVYGIHYCFNITTAKKEKPEAVLIRALKPTLGIDIMKINRNKSDLKSLCSGPGKLTQSLEIDLSSDGTRVDTGPVKVYTGLQNNFEITITTRVGISSACDWQLRYYIKENDYISRK